MILNDPLDLVQFMCFETMIGRQCDWIKPKFGLITISFGVNVRRLVAFIAEENKSITSNSKDGRHGFY